MKIHLSTKTDHEYGFVRTGCGMNKETSKVNIGERKKVTCKNCKKSEFYKNKNLRYI